MKKKKVILLTNIITPYIIPLFNYIDKNGDFDFNVVALAETEKNREWKSIKKEINFDYKILSGWHLFFYKKEREIATHLNWGVFKSLFRYNPDIIIIGGYNNLAYWQAFFYCKVFRKKYVLWNGTTLLSVGRMGGIYRLIKRIIVKGADRWIAYGTKAKEYLEYLGADPKNIYVSINTVDVNFFYKAVFRYRNSKNFLEERKQFPKIMLLYVGQIVDRKGVKQLLKSLNILHDPEVGLLIVGSGPEEKNLREFCKENRLNNIFFEGFHQQGALPKYYALADIFILPSLQEVWGLVVNEALASGLFVLCSKYAGVAYDLINKNNGRKFDPYNTEEIIEYIKEAKANLSYLRINREKIGRWVIENLGIEKSGDILIAALDSLTQQ